MTTFAEFVSRACQVGLDASLKSAILLAAAAMFTAFARGSSAATRHRVWSLALASSLLMPFVSTLLPEIQIPVLPPGNTPRTQPPSVAESPALPINQVHGTPSIPFEPIPRFVAPPTTSKSHELSDVVHSPPPASRRVSAAITVPFSLLRLALIGVWSVGLLSIWIGLTVAIARVRRRCLRCVPAPAGWIASVGDHLLRLRCPKTIRVLCETGSVVPIATGVFHPVILMPRESENWSVARRRYALLHELAHIERRDVLWQLVGQLALGLYWFNPLAWFAIRRLRIERELACDDRVVQLTGRASDYATELVEIARSARSLSPVMPAVAMAQASDLEHRLLAMFDRARSHVPLSRSTTLQLTLVSAVLLLLVGAIKPVARAFESEAKAQPKSQEPASSKKAAPAADAKEVNTPAATLSIMRVKVIDEEGLPIAGAKIHASIWDVDPTKRGDFPNRDYTTDESGIANIERPLELRILRLWGSHRDFVCLFAHWEEGEHDSGRLLPAEFTFKLPKGIDIGGQIVDEAGKPVAGVRIEATLRDPTPVTSDQPHVLFNTWLAIEGSRAVSDLEGRWIVKNVPRNFDRDGTNRVSLLFNHADYLPIPGSAQDATPPTFATDAMRARTLKTILKPGIRLEGVVLDPSGKPVAGALVIRGNDPYLEHGSQEELTDEQGRYRLPALRAGKLWITVIAKGWMPQMREIDLGTASVKGDFQLEPGRALKLKIVDQSGKPVSKCYVSIQEWRGKKSLHNHRHSNVIDTGIPLRADERGMYVWDWAPADVVQYQIGTPGYLYQEFDLTAGGELQTITLQPQSKVSGTVNDAVTGKPIPQFTVHPTVIFRKDFYAQESDESKNEVQGRFSLTLDRTDVSYFLLIESDGYRAAVGRPFHITSGDHQEDFKLEKAPLLKGRVLDPQGNPLKGAQVHLATVITPLQYDDENEFMGRPSYVTDESGRFQFVAQTGPYKLLAIHQEGYRRLDFDQDIQPGDFQLQPWARLEGTLWQEGRPVPNTTIFVEALREKAFDQFSLRESRQVKTNASGRFVFSRVPPTRITIHPLLSVWSEHPITSSRHVSLDLKPGQNVELDFGGRGAQVAGRVVLKGDVPLDFDLNYSLNYLILRGSALPPPAEMATIAKNAQEGWTESRLRSAEGQRYMELFERHFVRLRPDGTFLVNGVAPGEYDFAVSVYERPQGCLIDPIAIKITPVEITKADVDRGSVTLSDIEIPFPDRAKIGEPLPEITLRLSNGETMPLAQIRGKPLLVHGWAKWCEPCVKALPNLKSVRASIPVEKLTLLGINLDEDAAAAGEFATNKELFWDQAYVGDKSEAARRLGLSSVPTYLIVSSDGKLVVRTTDWNLAEAELKKLITP